MVISGVALFFILNVLLLSFSMRNRHSSYGTEQTTISITGPFQNVISFAIRFIKQIWSHYFALISVAEENERLKAALGRAIERSNRCEEVELANDRLRTLLDFQETLSQKVVAGEIIGKDPSPWFRSIIINKGKRDGLRTSLPVIVPEGVVGIVADVSERYAKILMLIDQNSAVDALVQRNRVRGLVRGEAKDICSLEYVLYRHDLREGDIVVTSGLDGVFPKGLRIGTISQVIKQNSGIFQEVAVVPFVDFETIEEVLVILSAPSYESFYGK
ncbi:rod shape-determining protein MreC [Desulfococcus multivorans]|uniref:rod shape-determining protein MreC n=1 Tax=Desulfococcus multivorans TaxID=897 RepID=UPI0013563422|nr:rod shape-determining protein MreC [Desulfococcus multivorans]